MKQNQINLIIIGFILVALMATNPSTDEHKEAVKIKVSAAFENNTTDGNEFQKLGEQLGQTIGMALIDKMIKRENYYLYSLTKSKFLNNNEEEKIVGFGFFGKVYLIDKFSDQIPGKIAYLIEESSNPIIGNTIKIGNIEVAQNDFPKVMKWEDAKKVCEKLGSGWRLPTKEELNTLYLNKDKIGGFANYAYWSSTEFDYDYAWYQYFSNGLQVNVGKIYTNYVRAVRAF